jgi:hypothetical protein
LRKSQTEEQRDHENGKKTCHPPHLLKKRIRVTSTPFSLATCHPKAFAHFE